MAFLVWLLLGTAWGEGRYGTTTITTSLSSYPSPQERGLFHLVNLMRLDAHACFRKKYCAISVDASVFQGVAPVRLSPALGENVRMQLFSNAASADPVAARVSEACARGPGGAGENLVTIAGRIGDDPREALAAWMCDAGADGACAPSKRGLSADVHREMLFDPTVPVCCESEHVKHSRCIVYEGQCHGECRTCTAQDPTMVFRGMGVGYAVDEQGAHHWGVQMTTHSTCDEVDGYAEDADDLYSGTHLLNIAPQNETRFSAVFWPDQPVDKLLYARVVVDGHVHDMEHDFGTGANENDVRGHFVLDMALPKGNAHKLAKRGCRAYHFEFAANVAGEERVSRFPASGELLAHREGGCSAEQGWMEESMRSKRQNDPLLEDLLITVSSQIRPENFLEGNDTSHRNNLDTDGHAQESSIAVTESAVFTFSVQNNGLALGASSTLTSDAFRIAVEVVCTAPTGGSALEVQFLDMRNTTGFVRRSNDPENTLDTGSASFVGLSGTWTTPVLTSGDVARLRVRVVTDETTQNGEITCTAVAGDVLNEFNGVLNEPELFDSGANLAATETVVVERRTDVALRLQRSVATVLATNDDFGATAAGETNAVTFVGTVTNNGPLLATNVVLGFRVVAAGGIAVSGVVVTRGSVSEPDVAGHRVWTLGTVVEGDATPPQILVTAEASAAAQEGEQQVFVEFFVRSMTERAIFTFDDRKENTAAVVRRVDVRLTHGMVLRRGVDEKRRHDDSGELVLYVQNFGPSEIAALTVETELAIPKGITIDSVRHDGSSILNVQRSFTEKDTKRIFLVTGHAQRRMWVAGHLGVGERKKLVFRFSPDRERSFSGPIQFGAAVVRRLLKESEVVRQDDDSLIVVQKL